MQRGSSPPPTYGEELEVGVTAVRLQDEALAPPPLAPPRKGEGNCSSAIRQQSRLGAPALLYLAVSMTNSCDYCIVSHTAAARKAGMNDAMLAELVSIVGMANATNRMVAAHRTEPDPRLIEAAKGGKK